MARMKEDKAKAYYEKYKQQNRFARRIGLPLLRGVYVLFVASILIQLTIVIAWKMNDPSKNVSHALLVNYGTDAGSYLKETFLQFQSELLDITLN